ncbi:hypothetical protein V6N13_103068 [Hibiscus sabdariffa]
MGGIDKTTLARVAYDQMSSHFEGKCFIAGVREVSDKLGPVFFFGRDAAHRRSAIKRLEKDSGKKNLDRLQISFDGSEETWKKYFFNGDRKDFVMKVLDGCEFFPDIEIRCSN